MFEFDHLTANQRQVDRMLIDLQQRSANCVLCFVCFLLCFISCWYLTDFDRIAQQLSRVESQGTSDTSKMIHTEHACPGPVILYDIYTWQYLAPELRLSVVLDWPQPVIGASPCYHFASIFAMWTLQVCYNLRGPSWSCCFFHLIYLIYWTYGY